MKLAGRTVGYPGIGIDWSMIAIRYEELVVVSEKYGVRIG